MNKNVEYFNMIHKASIYVPLKSNELITDSQKNKLQNRSSIYVEPNTITMPYTPVCPEIKPLICDVSPSTPDSASPTQYNLRTVHTITKPCKTSVPPLTPDMLHTKYDSEISDPSYSPDLLQSRFISDIQTMFPLCE